VKQTANGCDDSAQQDQNKIVGKRICGGLPVDCGNRQDN